MAVIWDEAPSSLVVRKVMSTSETSVRSPDYTSQKTVIFIFIAVRTLNVST